jgi:hypothetical protein
MRVVLHVDRIVMRGLPLSTSQLPILRAALEGELARLFRTVDARRLARVGSARRVVAKPFSYRPERGPARIGRQLARAVHSAASGHVSP